MPAAAGTFGALLALAGMVMVCASPAAARQLPSQAATEPALRIAGRVIDAATGAAMVDVRVEVVRTNLTASTDAAGRFVLDVPGSGRYLLTARVEGFDSSPPVEVLLTPAAPAATIDIVYRLMVSADVRGRAAAAPAEPLAPATVGRTSLDAETIALAPGALEDPFRVLQMQAGASPSTDDRNDVLVRGGGAIETAIRIDGFDVPSPSHFSAQGGSGGGLSMVSPWVIEHASLQPGGFSVQHGERASAVIDLALGRGNRTRAAGAAGAGVGGLMALAEGPLAAGRGGWLASVRRSFLEVVLERGDARAVPRYGDAVVKADLALGAAGRHRLTALALGGIDDVDARSGRDREDVLTDHQRVGVTGLSLASRWSSSTETAVFASFNTSEIDARAYDAGELDGLDRSIERELRLRGEVRRRIGTRGHVLAGVAARRAWLSFDLEAGSWRNEYGNLVRALQVVRREALTESGAFAEVSVQATPAAVITAGSRVDRFAPAGRVLVSPRARVEWALGAGMRATASVGVYRQPLPYVWLGSHPSNGVLPPIESRQATAGAEVRVWRGVRTSVEVFDKRYRDYPVDPVAPARVLLSAAANFESPFVGELVSAGRVRARGVDVAATAQHEGRLLAAVGYSWWHVTQSGVDGVWRSADYDLRHQARVSVRWTGGRRWSVGGLWRHATGRPYTPFDVQASVKAGGARYDRARINAVRYPPYHRLDVRGDWKAVAGRRITVVLYGEINNVYDRANVYLYEWNRRTRTSDPVYQWGRMPVAGVRLEF